MSLCVYVDVSTHIYLLLFHISIQAGRQTALPGAKPPHQVKGRRWEHHPLLLSLPIHSQFPQCRAELLLLLAYEPC